MTGSDALAPLAQMLTSLPDESVEGLLYSFNAVVNVFRRGGALPPPLQCCATPPLSAPVKPAVIASCAPRTISLPVSPARRGLQQFTRKLIVVPEPIAWSS